MPDDQLFHVLADQVREEDQLLPGNAGLQTVHVVPYVVDSGPARGHSGALRVVPADFTPDTIDRMIRDKITTLANIAQLGGVNAGMA